MSLNTGIWIDQKKAVIIKLKDKGEHIEEVKSGIERERYKGESDNKSRLYIQSIFPEKRMNRRKKEQLHKFYDEIIEKVKDSESLLVFGPSYTKNELRDEIMKRNDLPVRSVLTEPLGKVTRNQMLARARDFFSVSH